MKTAPAISSLKRRTSLIWSFSGVLMLALYVFGSGPIYKVSNQSGSETFIKVVRSFYHPLNKVTSWSGLLARPYHRYLSWWMPPLVAT